jgi:group I intron endonuclease
MARGIYKIINITNNKFYVGSAVDLKRRKTRHFSELRNRKHNNKHLQAAWDKYGEKSFIFVVVEELEADADVLAVENVWLKEHVGKEYCYNIGVDATAPSLGMCGELSPTFGRKRTPEELAAQSWKGKKHKPETIELMRQRLIGKPKSAETCAKISEALKGEGNYWYGKKRPDHGEKVSKMVFCMNDGIMFKSLQQTLQYYDIKMPTLIRALKSGKPITRGKLTGYTFKYGGIAQQTQNDINLINNKLLAQS